jgi:hypothetical protein
MATQYTGGLTTGQVLTAATMNSIGATWETWTPTITAQTGSFTTVTVDSARYGRINKLVYCQLVFTITAVGTGVGVPIFTLPVTGTTAFFLAMGSYREIANTGVIGIVSQESTTTGAMRQYNNAASIAAGAKFASSFFYEAA